ncbi:MAG: undecaprenyl-phosphate glucose phosphotransferase [Hyphomicrobiaceae bacterium]|nr:MAG: undecaprenyl-phosphate glucose phosphotransferase [Hyphomicrobiaceae bacterium]
MNIVSRSDYEDLLDVVPKPATSKARPRLAEAASGRPKRAISPVVVTGVVRALEFVAVVALGLFIKRLYVGEFDDRGDLHYWVALIAAGMGTSAAFEVLKLYQISAFHSAAKLLPRIWLGWTTVFSVLAAAAFFSKIGADFSRVWFAAWYICGAATLVCGRIALFMIVRQWSRAGRFNRRAVIVGGGPEGAALLSALEDDPQCDLKICGVFDDRGPDRVGHETAGYPNLGSTADLVEFARKTKIDLLIIAMPTTAEARIASLLKPLLVLPADVRLAAHSSPLRLSPRAYSWISSIPMLDIADKPIADWDHVQKWLFDKLLGLLTLTLAGPLMALIAIAIRLDSKGPVLFRQKRYGFNNELIEVFKFRSMYAEATDANAAKLVTKDDARVTRVGRFIRKTSLDELPQLFNVLKGDLSLVGPRPHAVQAKAGGRLYPEAVDNYFHRHKMKPGVTGWAQINGWRGETDTLEKIQMRVDHDIYYIENWSVLLDLYILVRTPFALLKAENAY